MVTAVASAQVPKFTVIIGGSFGAGNYGMCGRAYEPRFLWMWPNARISRHGRRAGRRRAGHCRARRHRRPRAATGAPQRRSAFKAPIRAQYETQGHPYYATARLWDDGIIDPADTRMCWAWAVCQPRTHRSTADALRRVPHVSAAHVFDTILIANRGEIACRIIAHRAAPGHAQRRGVSPTPMPTRCTCACADEAVAIGPAPARESYLRIDALIAAARRTGAQAIHPGYGFLSENADVRRGLRAGGAGLHRPAGRGDPRHGLEVRRQGADAAGRRAAGARLSRRRSRSRRCCSRRPTRSAIRC